MNKTADKSVTYFHRTLYITLFLQHSLAANTQRFCKCARGVFCKVRFIHAAVITSGDAARRRRRDSAAAAGERERKEVSGDE